MITDGLGCGAPREDRLAVDLKMLRNSQRDSRNGLQDLTAEKQYNPTQALMNELNLLVGG